MHILGLGKKQVPDGPPPLFQTTRYDGRNKVNIHPRSGHLTTDLVGRMVDFQSGNWAQSPWFCSTC
jgi:hypothetical protein